MGIPPDQMRVTSLIREGLRQLRAGKVKAALHCWEDALALDDGHASAQSYIDYIKKNRIRIAVHLGRTPPLDDEAIDIPESWPEPPEGLCDPVPADEPHAEPTGPDDAADADAAPEDQKGHRPVTKSSGHLPYAEIELSGTSSPRLSDVMAKGKTPPPAESAPPSAKKAPPAPRPPAEAAPTEEPPKETSEETPEETPEEAPARRTQVRPTTGDDYLVMEIVVDDDEPPADPRTLPPPPEALAAPEMIIEAPKQDAEKNEPEDYLYDRASSQQLESLSLDRLASSGEAGGTPPPPPTPPAAAPPDDALDDAPTQMREHTPSNAGPSAAAPAESAPGEDAPSPPQTPVVATTFDEVATNPRSDPQAFSRPPPGGAAELSPYTTLAGLGPRVLFAEFGDKDLQGEAPPLEFAPPQGEDPAPGIPGSETPDEFSREPGSFSEDAPTRALDTQAKPPGVRMDAPVDFAREEGSFSDDIPTTARRSSSSAAPQMPARSPGDFDREQGSFSDDLPTRARPSTVQEGAGVIPEPQDFEQEQGSFSDDIPTTARPDLGSDAGIRAMPLDHDFRREGSFSDDLATLERSRGHKEERLSEEMEALLHPDRGIALAKQLFDAGELTRSLQLTEQLQGRYPTLEGISALLEANQKGLEGKLMAQLGDLDTIPVPKTADLVHDNKDLDPRAAFLFSRIDGTMSLQDIIDISGMTEFESARILLRLREIGLLDFGPPR